MALREVARFFGFFQVECQSWKSSATHLVDLFSLSWQEQQRSEALLSTCLPMLKEHFLLLSSYEQRPERRQQYRVR